MASSDSTLYHDLVLAETERQIKDELTETALDCLAGGTGARAPVVPQNIKEKIHASLARAFLALSSCADFSVQYFAYASPTRLV